MGLDRTNDEYRPLAILFDNGNEDLAAFLDECVDRWRRGEFGEPVSWQKAFRAMKVGKLSHGEQTLLRLAVFFWNGELQPTYSDMLCLDDSNRVRVVLAWVAFYEVHRSHIARAVADALHPTVPSEPVDTVRPTGGAAVPPTKLGDSGGVETQGRNLSVLPTPGEVIESQHQPCDKVGGARPQPPIPSREP